jgi:hypothetical protein
MNKKNFKKKMKKILKEIKTPPKKKDLSEEDSLEDKENHRNSASRTLELYLLLNSTTKNIKKTGANTAEPDSAPTLQKDPGDLELFVLYITLTGNKKKHLDLITSQNFPKNLSTLMLTRLNLTLFQIKKEKYQITISLLHSLRKKSIYFKITMKKLNERERDNNNN